VLIVGIEPPVAWHFTSFYHAAGDATREVLLDHSLQQESFIAPALGGATVGWLQDRCDCICRLVVAEEEIVKEVKIGKSVHRMLEKTGKYVRYLRTGYHPNYAAGVRSANPEKIPEVIVKPTMKKLLEVIRG
jgi:hypothetical protein